MPEILLVEDAKFFRTVLKSQIEGRFGYTVVACENYAEAVNALISTEYNFSLALLDLNLPDAPDGEVVDVVSGHGVPSIIFSGSFLEEIRDQLEKPNVIDYVVKDSPASLNYVVNTVDRFYRNHECKVLVVDDSKVAAKHMAKLLTQFNFDVIVAHNGQEALKAYQANDDIRMVICDFNMPDMLGVEVCKRIRAKKSRDEICFIGVSAYGTHAISAQFLKAGANDFLVKPFLTEEFFCRVTLNMDALDKVAALDKLVHTDLVTQLQNRRFLEDKFKSFCKTATTLNRKPVCAFFELDDFRNFNDEHGNDAGDAILFMIAENLKKHFDDETHVIRYGGSQFCVLAMPQGIENFVEILREAHQDLSNQHFDIDEKALNIGLTTIAAIATDGEFDNIITKAKEAIKNAKKNNYGSFFVAE